MTDLTPERRAELRELAEDADDINGWATEDYYDEDDECSAHLVSTGEARQFRIALGMQEWNAAYIAAAQPAVLTALLDAADERDRLAAAVERVRALHVADGEGFCGVCDYMTPHPCPTIRALDGRHE